MSEQAAEAEMAEEMPLEEQLREEARVQDDGGAQSESGARQQATAKEAQAPFDELAEGEEAPRADPSLDVILNIPVTLSMEVGRTRMTIRELMELKRGSVVKFDRLAGEPMDVLVNGTLVAHGEVVVVNDRFGIRLTDVVSPEERVRRLR